MSRGGRRRKGKRGRSVSGAPERRSAVGELDVEERESQPSGRRRGSGRSGSGREVSVVDQMTSRPQWLRTLPPDGTVLEDLIGAMQSEYGVPATPQEYRLIIKTPVPEEQTDPSLELKPLTVVASPDSREEQVQPTRLKAARRRRRGRRRGLADDGPGGELEPLEPAAEDNPAEHKSTGGAGSDPASAGVDE